MFRILWLAFWNLGLFALSICVLSGCRTRLESNYSIVNWNRPVLQLIWGEECANVTAEFIPDVYKLGSSGTCRIVGGDVSCKSHFPPSLNLAKAVLEDLDQANSTGLPPAAAATLERCRASIDKPIAHSTAEKLGVAMISFIFASILLNIVSIIVAAASENPWGWKPTAILVVDTLFIFTSIILCIAVMNYEGGGYLNGIHGQQFSDREMIGIALWMLLGMLIGRILSNPWLLIMALAIILPIGLAVGLTLFRMRGFLSFMQAYSAE